MRSRLGLALIVTAGVLGILAVLAAAFVTVAQLERKASGQRLFQSKAVLLARAGIEDALARIGAGQDPEVASNRYGGEDWDNSGGALHPVFEAPHEIYRPGEANRGDCPVRHALRPSFPAMNGLDPRRIDVDLRQRGYSGRLGGGERETYALRVLPQAGIHLNGGDPAYPASEGYNANLRRMLGTLAEAIDREDGEDDATPVDSADGWALVDSRPPQGWKDWAQVRDLALGGSQPKLDALREYLALHAWVDGKVIRPNPAYPALNAAYESWSDLRLAHDAYPDSAPGVRRAPDFERIPVAPTGKVVGRAPVNLAWARKRRPVLIALLGGIKGRYLDEYMGFGVPTQSFQGYLRQVPVWNTWNASCDVSVVADRILTSTSELSTWQQWDAFCDTLAVTGSGYAGTASTYHDSAFRQAKRDLLKAHANPNSDLNKFNPCLSLWRAADKQDLIDYTTEFCLEPLHGFELACVGRIRAEDGRLLASRTVTAEMGPAQALRLTTQGEFVCGALGVPGRAGDEADPRLPGNPAFLSESQGPAGTFTWGHRLSPGGWMGGASKGVSLQSYPEPYVGMNGLLSLPAPADYDGSLQLATVETPDDETYTVSSGPDDLKMLAGFDDNLRLDVADGDAAVVPDALLAATASDLVNGLLHVSKPVTLNPDGIFSEKDRAPAYRSASNAHGLHGLLSFWVKPHYTALRLTGPGDGGTRHRNFVLWANLSSHPWDPNYHQTFQVADAYNPGAAWSAERVTGFLFETGHQWSDQDLEHGFAAEEMPHLHHRWMLLTCLWDQQSPDLHGCGEFVFNSGSGPGEQNSNNAYGVFMASAMNATTFASDMTAPDAEGANLIHLGSATYPNLGILAPACATIDEFAIWDFGSLADNGIARTLASERYREGRYYKESDYAGLSGAGNKAGRWLSAPVDLGPVRMKALSWTQRIPAETPAGRIAFELADASGSGYAPDASGIPMNALHVRSSGSRIDRNVSSPFRLHAVFQPNLDPTTMGDTPLLEPLALDDVTVVHEPVGGRTLLTWAEGS